MWLMWLSEQITSVELVIQFTDATITNLSIHRKSIDWHLATKYL